MRHYLHFLFLLCSYPLLAQGKGEQRRTTDVGSIRLSISSFGTIGTGFAGWPRINSCEYPRGSGIENLFVGGLWIGGIRDVGGSKVKAVSTGAVDVSSVINLAQGFEFTNSDSSYLIQMSSLPNDLYFSPDAVSHRDYLCHFTDTNLIVPELNQRIPDHLYPLGIDVNFRSYAWNFGFADYFVLLTYSIKNVLTTPIDSVYIGLWTDLVVRNTTVRAPRGGDFYRAGGNGLIDSMRMMYEWDISGDNGLADNYAAIRLLGTEPPATGTFYNTWAFQDSRGDEWLQSPQNDIEKFRRLSSTFLNQVSIEQALPLIGRPGNRSQLISTGPFVRLNPGDSINIAFAVICAKKPGAPDKNDDESRKTLISNAGWAQRAYNGTDINGNNVLDSNETDLKGNGKIVRYILPSPPAVPRYKLVVGDKKATLYWTDNSENSRDLLSNRKNFEGYRIYRSNPGDELTRNQEMIQIASFDKPGNALFYDNGFDQIRIKDENGSVTTKVFPGDTNIYRYQYEFANLLNGWQYRMALTSFSDGDELSGLPSLESSILQTEKRFIPGTEIQVADTSTELGIFPNPYYGSAVWDAKSNPERGRKIYFYNLPRKAKITIFTLSGDIVKTMQHEAGSSEGQSIQWFTQTGTTDATPPQFSGGIHAWDIITDNDQALASGFYIVKAENMENGKVQTGRFLIVK
jgi:hypothetical protein